MPQLFTPGRQAMLLPPFLTGHTNKRSLCCAVSCSHNLLELPVLRLYKLYPSPQPLPQVSWAPILLPRKLWFREVGVLPREGHRASKR